MEEQTEVRDLVSYVFSMPIPKEHTDQVLKDAESLVTWVKPTAKGFEDSNEMEFEEFHARISNYIHYYGKWDGDTMEKIYNAPDQVPEGYQKRCELHFLAQDNQRYGLDLAPASYRNLCKYIARLDQLGKSAQDVITRITAREMKGKLQDNTPTCYNLVCFEPKEVISFREQQPPTVVADDPIPF